VSFHALRHSHASALIAAGVDVMTVSRRLGRGSPAITLSVYGHLFSNTDDRALTLRWENCDRTSGANPVPIRLGQAGWL
jgi:integrase